MVGVRNSSEKSRVAIAVMCDGKESARQQVELGKPAEVRDYFFPIEAGAKVVRVQLDGKDDFAGDDVGFLVRRGSWPRIEARIPVFAELERFIEKYSKVRVASAESKGVAIGDEIILGKVGAGVSGKASVADHAVMRELGKVDWGAMAADGVAELPEGGGWEVLVKVSEKAVLAVKNGPVRQVWVGVSTQKMASSPEFVILWSNIFDWVGEGGEELVSRTTGNLGTDWKPLEPLPAGLKPGWWPGIYRRADGAMLAVNAPDVVGSEVSAGDWKARLAGVAKEQRELVGMRWLTTQLLLSAMGLMVIAAMTWRGGLRHRHTSTRGHGTQHGQDARVTV